MSGPSITDQISADFEKARATTFDIDVKIQSVRQQLATILPHTHHLITLNSESESNKLKKQLVHELELINQKLNKISEDQAILLQQQIDTSNIVKQKFTNSKHFQLATTFKK